MKKIESKDLVIGQEYYDIPDFDTDYATVFKFIGRTDSKDIFEYVRGDESYGLTYRCIFISPDQWYQP